MPTPERLSQLVLLGAAVGLFPVALSYGLAPERSLRFLFGIDASGVNTRHIFRAIMGLYLVTLSFWVLGAIVGGLRVPALWSLCVFMGGLALGRVLSLMLDGWPHPLLGVYTILELVAAGLAFRLLGAISKAPDQK